MTLKTPALNSVKSRARYYAKTVIVLTILTSSFKSYADNGLADILLKSVATPESINQKNNSKHSESDDVKTIANTNVTVFEDFKITDPFLRRFHAEWVRQSGMHHDVNSWVKMILTQKFEDASHMWSLIVKQVPQSFESTAYWAQAYLGYQLKLENVLLDQINQALKVSQKRDADTANSFFETVQPEIERLISSGKLYVSSNLLSQLEHYETSGLINTQLVRLARSWSYILNPRWTPEVASKALVDIDYMSLSVAIKLELAKRLVVYYSSTGQLGIAGKIAKAHLESGLQKLNEPEKISDYYMMLGRLLFQAEAFEAAEKIYKTIPKGSQDYLAAQEELAWVFLRSGRLAELRGWVKSFDSGLFDAGFYPEVQVVGAVSSLKLCYYNDVKSAFDRFQKSLKPWASKIESELGKENALRPDRLSYAGLAYEKLGEAAGAEIEKIQKLNERSIAASLPAVGVQSHWNVVKNKMIDLRAETSKRKLAEYKKYWVSQSLSLKEAIRKMKFVKIEFLNQISQVKADRASDAISVSQAQTLQSQKSDFKTEPKTSPTSFEFDGLVWPDELFNLKSQAEGKCIQ